MSPRDSAPTIAAILRAADELLEAGGPEAVTLRAVGETAGVSRMTPYRHFADKAALLHALAERTLLAMARHIRAAAAEEDEPGAKLRAGSGAYLDHALENPHHYQLIFGDAPLAQPGPELDAAADDAMRAVEEIVGQAQTSGVLRDAPTRELATVLWVLLHGLAALQITGHLHEPRTVDGSAHLGTLLDLALAQLAPIDHESRRAKI
ncbi:TetR/AcrR family transcriptional regulator [Brachybacterium hainanense]|uniref:TetR/AcrR family transcriptional regulator n=1 Tax=Brachybacterium hainanense TaxID=1541174 RepID=A0ABV6RA04_9MICO